MTMCVKTMIVFNYVKTILYVVCWSFIIGSMSCCVNCINTLIYLFQREVFFAIAILNSERSYIGTVGRMSRPLVLPEVFSGEASWDQWIFHFENVAKVNG